MNLLQVGLRTKQILGKIPTICKKCNCVETTKFYDSAVDKLPIGSFTKRCKCGTWIYRFHDVLKYPDENNKVILECGRMVEQKDEDEAVKCTGRLELTSTELKKLQEEYKDKFPEGL